MKHYRTFIGFLFNILKRENNRINSKTPVVGDTLISISKTKKSLTTLNVRVIKDKTIILDYFENDYPKQIELPKEDLLFYQNFLKVL